MDHETSEQASPVSFDEAILKAKVAQICNSIGYHAITQDSSNILVDTYRRLFHHLARHCKDAANNNRRVEPTLLDLAQAFKFVNISNLELQEHIETVKLPLNVKLTQDTDCKSLKGIQRNLLVDYAVDTEKNSHDGENKASNEFGLKEEQPSVPLLKDTYVEIANKFANCTPVKADKRIRSGRITLVANTKLKISTIALDKSVESIVRADNQLERRKKEMPSTTQAQPPNSHDATSEDELCPKCSLPNDGSMMIQCDNPFCAKWFHFKCVNLLKKPKKDESWFCKVCVDADGATACF